MQAFVVGLLLAGVSATSVVAFRHPYGYAKLFPYLIGAATALFVAVSVWQAGVEMTWHSLDPYLSQEHLEEATATKRELSLPYPWVVMWYLGIVVFFWINLRLPPFLQVAEQNHNEAETKR